MYDPINDRLLEKNFVYKPDRCLCFTGHRHLDAAETELIRARLPKLLMRCVENGIDIFISGGALGFDTLAAEAVLELREKEEPGIQLLMAVPCLSQSLRWSDPDQYRYWRLLDACDEIKYVSLEYYPGCMQKRNRFMVDHAETCICYMTRCRGGTWNTVSYAYDMGRTIINLASER